MVLSSALPIVCQGGASAEVKSRIEAPKSFSSSRVECPPVYLDVLQQPLDDAQQDVPCDHLQLLAVLLDEPGDGKDDFIGHHFIGAGHGLHYVRGERERDMLFG